MVNLSNETLSITIVDSEPAQRRERLIKALAASIRWNAYSPCKNITDHENMHELAQLLDELTNTNI